MQKAAITVKTERVWQWVTFDLRDKSTHPIPHALILMRVITNTGHTYVTGYCKKNEELNEYTYWYRVIEEGRARIYELMSTPTEWCYVYSPSGAYAV